MTAKQLISFVSRWFVRAEFTSRIMGLALRVLQVAMFCRIFEMKPLGYIITSGTFVVFFVVTSWALDKTMLRQRIEGETGKRSEPIVEILESLKRIERRLDERN